MAISFNSHTINYKLKQKTAIKQWVSKVVASEKKTIGNINYNFTSDEELLKINLQYLKHNTYTDIITFDYTEGKKISGDIFISIDRVNENAQKLNQHPDEELRRVIIHGVLHLCGHKDKTKIDSDNMRALEDKALRLWKRLNK